MAGRYPFTRGPARLQCPAWRTAAAVGHGPRRRDRRIYAGWFVEASKLDTLDQAMAQAGFAHVTIKHGGGNLVTHWAVRTANLFVVAEGVQGDRRDAARPALRDRVRLADARRRPAAVAAARACCCASCWRSAIGARAPDRQSTLTGDVIAALTGRYAVLDAVDAFRAADKSRRLARRSTPAASARPRPGRRRAAGR